LPPRTTPTPLPYTTLFRSHARMEAEHLARRGELEQLRLRQRDVRSGGAYGGVARIIRVRQDHVVRVVAPEQEHDDDRAVAARSLDRKSTRLNSSHGSISYA